jgi:hypothetical protein
MISMRPSSRMRSAIAFTMVEVLSVLLLMGMGMTAAVAMYLYAQRLNGRVAAEATALATAWTVLYDAAPGVRPGDSDSDWIDNGPVSANLGSAAAYPSTRRGQVNGFFVQRIETALAGDQIDAQSRMVQVEVRVYNGDNGELVAVLAQRFARRNL